MLLALALTSSLGAALLWLTTRQNLKAFAPPQDPPFAPADAPLVSVCIPARDEADNLRPCVEAILANDYPNLEILIYDDQSSDGTREIAAQLAADDPRVKLLPTFPMPTGWSGKNHACAQLGLTAAGRWLLFTDADVRFGPRVIASAVAFAEPRDLALASTFPRQITGSLGERLVIPMIFFILLAYLPFGRMRSTTSPPMSAGCGQFLLVRRDAYRQAGGHTAFPQAIHDGIELARLMRRRGHKTDLFDGTDLLSVRMYTGLAETWRGFAKNAYAGVGSLGLLIFFTLLHAAVYLLPWILLPLALIGAHWIAAALAAAAIVIAIHHRAMLGRRFGQPLGVALLHPLAIAMLTAVQWYSLWLTVTGRREWRGRVQTEAPIEERLILVDQDDQPVGETTKQRAHEQGGQRHRAFSVLLFDDDGRTLLQRRAPVKYHFAGRWANACCGHPRPGETTVDAAQRRLLEELGVHADLREIARFNYRASDPDTGLIEDEIDHVLVGRAAAPISPNPLEADQLRWVTPDDLADQLTHDPASFAPWFPLVWQQWLAAEASAPAPTPA